MYFAVNELKSIELSSQGKHAAEEVDNSAYNCDEGDVSVTTMIITLTSSCVVRVCACM